MASNDYFYALGRRKSATARVRLQSGKGTILVNDKPAEEYFADSKYLLGKLNQPFASSARRTSTLSARMFPVAATTARSKLSASVSPRPWCS
jgi:ribosomal protein S9